MSLKLPRSAWSALATLTACAADVASTEAGCVCRVMPRMRRAYTRLDAVFSATTVAMMRGEADRLWGLPVAGAVSGALIDASIALASLADAVVDAAEQEEGARAKVRAAAANLTAMMGRLDRKLIRLRRATARLDRGRAER